ncbi:hypothetical protein Sjap_012736 [Stephania japonica]|uniref:Uncharacterized protein n=1 Tax=Stephania japonica TaxID=461633 RepID=A0AAP0IWP3_9MAGN
MPVSEVMHIHSIDQASLHSGHVEELVSYKTEANAHTLIDQASVHSDDKSSMITETWNT